MDKHLPQAHMDLLQAALTAVQWPGLDWSMVEKDLPCATGHEDAVLRLRFDGREVLYLVQLKRGLRRATLGAVLHQMLPCGEKALLVTDYITPQMADELRERDVQFIDAAGNAYLRQPPLYVWVKGQRPPQDAVGLEPAGRAFRPTGLQVLFTLLCQPEVADLPYREIAVRAGVAHGTVGWVMAELPKLGFIAGVQGRRRLVDAERLLDQWVLAYALTLRPKLILVRYEAAKLEWAETIDAPRYDLLLGGEPAAARLTRNLRPGTVTLYGKKANPRLLVDHRLQPNRQGNVEILRRFWTFEGETPGMVPHLLVYADLLATGDTRCIETAGGMRADIINRFK